MSEREREREKERERERDRERKKIRGKRPSTLQDSNPQPFFFLTGKLALYNSAAKMAYCQRKLLTWCSSVRLLVKTFRPVIGQVRSFSRWQVRPRNGCVDGRRVADVDGGQRLDGVGELGLARERVQDRFRHGGREKVELQNGATIKSRMKFP